MSRIQRRGAFVRAELLGGDVVVERFIRGDLLIIRQGGKPAVHLSIGRAFELFQTLRDVLTAPHDSEIAMSTYTRELLLAELEHDEAFKAKVYDDKTGRDVKTGDRVEGILTVGIGRNLQDKGLTLAEARYLAGNDVDEAEADLDKRVPWWRGLSDARQRVLLNMRFNMGWGRLAGFKNMLAAAERGDFARAADEMKSSAWAGQVGARAVRLIKLMRDG